MTHNIKIDGKNLSRCNKTLSNQRPTLSMKLKKF